MFVNFHLLLQIVNLQTNKVARILGKVENNDRFLRIALYQSDRNNKRIRKVPAAAANANESKDPLTDPTLLCCAFKKHRIYLFRCQTYLSGKRVIFYIYLKPLISTLGSSLINSELWLLKFYGSMGYNQLYCKNIDSDD